MGANFAGQVIGFAGDIMKAKLGAISVTRLSARKSRIDSSSPDGQRINSLESGHIEFRNVHFTYPTRYLRLHPTPTLI
jgi:hypothetical protein